MKISGSWILQLTAAAMVLVISEGSQNGWGESYKCLDRFAGVSDISPSGGRNNTSLSEFLSSLCWANNGYVDCLNSTLNARPDGKNVLRDVLNGLCDRHTIGNLTEQQECLAKLNHLAPVNMCMTLFLAAVRKEYQRHEKNSVVMEPYCEIVDEFLTCTQEPIRHACGPDASLVVKRILLELADRMFSGRCGLLRGGCFLGKLVYKALNDAYFNRDQSFASVHTSSQQHCARVCNRNPFCLSALYSPANNNTDGGQTGLCELTYTQQNCTDLELNPMEAYNHPSLISCLKCEVV